MKKQDDLKERAKQFALRIIRLFSSLPKTAEAQVLGKQIASLRIRSVGANYDAAKQIDCALDFANSEILDVANYFASATS